MRSSSSFLLVTALVGTFVVGACSDDSSTGSTNTTGDGGGGSSSGGSSSGGSSSGGSSSGGSSSGGSSGNPDAATLVSNCSTFVDRTAADASREIKWDFGVSSLPERCMRIKVGQKAKFGDGAGGKANFAAHPVSANGGTQPNPVTNVDTNTGEISFTTKGTYGFVCGVHPAMLGAFEVVE